ncbi:MAG TPA: DinB family protein, partial [Agriterribacter sp.]
MLMHTALIGELRHEASNTRRILERIPEDQLNWKPHEKSMPLLRLACHIAELPQWVDHIMTGTEFNFATDVFNRINVSSRDELLEIFELTLERAVEFLEKTSDEELNMRWTLRRAELMRFELPRKVAIRNLVMNHIIH